jgi:hypothetical protein
MAVPDFQSLMLVARWVITEWFGALDRAAAGLRSHRSRPSGWAG